MKEQLSVKTTLLYTLDKWCLEASCCLTWEYTSLDIFPTTHQLNVLKEMKTYSVELHVMY